MELKQSMSDMITRCPKCQTSFRITPAQLQTAKGSVRCGSCLHIFKAADHLVPSKPAAKPAAAANKTSANAPASARKFDAANATVVRPLAANPKFEYKRPNNSAVSTNDIANALRSSLDNHAEDNASPAPSSQSNKSKTPGPDNAGFGIPDDVLEENESLPIGADEGQQNMLVFDQAAIDAEDGGMNLGDDEDLLISDDMKFGSEDAKPKSTGAYGDDLSESFLDLDSWSPKETSLFDHKNKPPKEEEDSDDKHSPDESWAIELLEEDGDEEENIAYSGVHAALDELDLEMEEPDSGPKPEEYSRATTGSFNALDDSDIEEALGVPLSEHIEPKIDTSEPVTEKDFYPEFDYDDDYDDGEFGESSYGESAYQDDTDGDYYSRAERTALLRGIRPAPVEFNRFAGRRDWRSIAIWGGSITAGVLLLILQVAWLQFETLSRQQPYRSLYSAVGVNVPPLLAPTMIRASNLVVRSHPNADNALMVDAILLNTASFTQPFPDLVLNFSNIEGKTLVARRFKPSEYLAGELAGRTQMPIGQPVHLSLEIVDPGPDAVSYSAYIPN